MYRNEINNLVKDNKEEIIEYLITFNKEFLKYHANDIEELCDNFNFDLKHITITGINTKSYLKNQEDRFLIVVNDKLKEKDKELEIYKELITYFIIRYYIDEGKIDENDLNKSHYYFHYPIGTNDLEIDFISEYFANSLINKEENKTENKNFKKLKHRLVRMERNEKSNSIWWWNRNVNSS